MSPETTTLPQSEFWRPSAPLRVATGLPPHRPLAVIIMVATLASMLSLLAAGTASAGTPPQPETRVAAQTTPEAPAVAAEQPGTPVFDGETTTPSYDLGRSLVAPRVADDLVDLASSSRRSHILDGEVRPNGTYGGGHRAGTECPGKSEFPASWSDDQVMHYISDVATDPFSTTVRTQGRDAFVAGTRDGIDIEVLIRNGEIWTASPTNVPRNQG